MKFFIVFGLCIAVASARFVIPDVAAAEAAEIKEILATINNPSTDPATAAALQQLLNDILGIEESPIHVGPAIVDEFEESPSAPGPVIVDQVEDSPIHVGPAIIDDSDLIDVRPVVVDEKTPSNSPLVQIILNVNSGTSVADSPVVVEGPEPTPVIIAERPEEFVEEPIINTPIFPSPVIIDESPEEIVEEPIINTPILPSPVVVPDTLN